jgi:hypothetical protein
MAQGDWGTCQAIIQGMLHLEHLKIP